jgi:osmotically-inducible protein OsmY
MALGGADARGTRLLDMMKQSYTLAFMTRKETMSTEETSPKGIYSKYWDNFVSTWSDRPAIRANEYQWPGDEWGNPEEWDFLFQKMFVPAGVEQWQRAIEIGPGSGKYTLKVLGASPAVVRAYDMSAAYLDVCRSRCRQVVDEGRLSLHVLDINRPNQILADAQGVGWERSVDAVYSIAAMVHVDLQYLVAYLLNAALALKQGGKLLLTLADATSPKGFAQLMKDIRWAYPAQANPSGSAKFEWLSPDLIRHILTRLGFIVSWIENHERDIFLVATLADLKPSEALREHIAPDAELERNVLEELKWEPSVDAAHIGVSVKNGIVTLRGHVPSYAEKCRAERLAKRVHGLKTLANEVEVKLPFSSQRTDEEVATACVNALKSSNPVPSDKVRAIVNKGSVTLEGEVEWQFQKEAAERAVRDLTGVTGVSSLIAVKPQVSPTDVRREIEDAFKRNDELKLLRRMTIEVDGGKVTLRGTVFSWAQKEAAARVAWAAPGVHTVQNLITVEPM